MACLKVVEVDSSLAMRDAAQVDDPRLVRAAQQRKQLCGEREMPQVVGGELALPTMWVPLQWAGHDCRVVDQNMQWHA